jgi:hypothetical protein
MRIVVLTSFMVVALCPCVHTKLTDWDKPGASMAEFYADSGDYQREANNSGATVLGLAGIYNRCMEARGYRRLFSSLLGPRSPDNKGDSRLRRPKPLTGTRSWRVISGMRSLIASFILVLFAGSVTAAEGWTRFRDPSGNFTVEFHQLLPRATTQVSISLIGENVPITMYAVRDRFGIMAVVDAPVLDRKSTSSQILEKAAKRLIANLGGIVQSDMPDMLDGQLGRRISILGTDGSLHASRVFYFNGHLYLLNTATVGAPNARIADAVHFSQSLRFIVQR